jgi:hypothetical protein
MSALEVCAFSYREAPRKGARRSEALELFTNVRERRNPIALILSAMRLSRGWEEGLWHAS